MVLRPVCPGGQPVTTRRADGSLPGLGGDLLRLSVGISYATGVSPAHVGYRPRQCPSDFSYRDGYGDHSPNRNCHSHRDSAAIRDPGSEREPESGPQWIARAQPECLPHTDSNLTFAIAERANPIAERAHSYSNRDGKPFADAVRKPGSLCRGNLECLARHETGGCEEGPQVLPGPRTLGTCCRSSDRRLGHLRTHPELARSGLPCHDRF